MKFLHIEVSLKVIVDLPVLKKYVLQNIIPCVAVENSVTCCEVLNLTYFPSLSRKKYFLYIFNQGERSCQSLCGGELILGSHIIRETWNSKEGYFHINLAWSSKRCEHLHDEMQEEMDKVMENMQTWHKNQEISYAHDLTVLRRKYEVIKSHVNRINSKLEMKSIGWIRKMISLKNMKSPPNGRSLWY